MIQKPRRSNRHGPTCCGSGGRGSPVPLGSLLPQGRPEPRHQAPALPRGLGLSQRVGTLLGCLDQPVCSVEMDRSRVASVSASVWAICASAALVSATLACAARHRGCAGLGGDGFCGSQVACRVDEHHLGPVSPGGSLCHLCDCHTTIHIGLLTTGFGDPAVDLHRVCALTFGGNSSLSCIRAPLRRPARRSAASARSRRAETASSSIARAPAAMEAVSSDTSSDRSSGASCGARSGSSMAVGTRTLTTCSLSR